MTLFREKCLVTTGYKKIQWQQLQSLFTIDLANFVVTAIKLSYVDKITHGVYLRRKTLFDLLSSEKILI